MKSIPLSQNYYALTDDEDFDWLSQWEWCYDHGYARRVIIGKIKLYMHTAICEQYNLIYAPELDHKDGNGLNNQKSNFRAATRSEQNANRGKQDRNKSGYIGVWYDKRRNSYQARIGVNGQTIHAGRYKCKIEAAKARDELAKIYFGEFAILNFPGE